MTRPAPRLCSAWLGRRLRVGPTAVLPLLLPSTVAAQLVPHAAMINRRTVRCPVCSHTFEVFAPGEGNRAGGTDRDLFARDVGPQTVFYLVSTCPSCLFSGYAADFSSEHALPPSLVRKVREKPGLPRPAGVTKDTEQALIDPVDRYELTIRCYEWAQRSDEALAWLHLRASWVIRDGESITPPNRRLERVQRYARRWRGDRAAENPADEDLRTATLAAAAVAEGRLNAYQDSFVRYYLAFLLRRHGENRTAHPFLEGAARNALLDAPLREAAARMARSIPREQEHQRKALAHFERAILAEQVSPTNRPVAIYLAAELCRRLGRHRDAARWLDRMPSDAAALPDAIREWVREIRENGPLPASP